MMISADDSFRATSRRTNIPPAMAYQGFDSHKRSFAMQLAAAEMADASGMDPLAFPERNPVREGSVLEILCCLGEGREGRAQPVSSCGLGPSLEREAAWISRVQREEPRCGHRKVGQGAAIAQQGSGLQYFDADNAVFSRMWDDTLMVHSSVTDLGTGRDTVVVTPVAGRLRVPTDSVDLVAAGARHLGEPREGGSIATSVEVRGSNGTVSYDRIARSRQSGTGTGQLVAWEEMMFDARGRGLDPTLRDDRVPMIGDLPAGLHAELVCTGDPLDPDSARSIAEVSCDGAAPAMAAAIRNAVGVWIRDWPHTPEKALRALGSL